MKHVVQLAGVIGTRASATPGMERAAGYIAAQLRDAGYAVTEQHFPVKTFENRETSFEVLQPERRALAANPLHYASTGDVTGGLVDGGLGRQEDFRGKDLRGSVALVQRGGLLLSEKAANATASGAAAVVIYNNRPGQFYGSLREGDRTVPTVSLSDEDGSNLAGLLRKEKVVVRVKVDALTRQGEGLNIVGQWPQRGAKAIVIGAHYDSVPVGPGANDNASGVAVMLELARLLALRGEAKNVMIIAFAGEEQGLVGSSAFVEGLDNAERSRLTAMLNLDMVGEGKTLSIGFAGGAKAEGHAALAVEVAKKVGMPTESGAAGADSDHWPFAQMGLPVIYLDTGLDPYYHTPEDKVDKVMPVTMRQSGLVALGVAERLIAEMR